MRHSSGYLLKPGYFTQVHLLAKDFADDSRNLLSPPCSLQTFGQFRIVLGLSEFPQECSGLGAGRSLRARRCNHPLVASFMGCVYMLKSFMVS